MAELPIERERFKAIKDAMTFLGTCAEFEVVSKDHRPYMNVMTFALVEKKNRRVIGFLQEHSRASGDEFYYTEGEND